MMLKFPYGLRNFYDLITDNYFYVDRTAHIPIIENFGKELIFLRPRRFGKSLLLSMLENYYDVAKANEFERLFGHLAIGKHPTPKHNQYFVMTWDFSCVKAQGDSTAIEKALYNHVNHVIANFAIYYKNWLQHEILIDPCDAIASFQSLLTAVEQSGYRLYLLIDEYDNFANELMIEHRKENPSRYSTLLSSEGIVKTLFKAVKSASRWGLERVFITGVSPIVLADMSSGYNVGDQIHFEPEFNDLCGFHEPEIQEALAIIVRECGLPIEKIQEALALMKNFYDGYCFSSLSTDLVYNPTLALYFFKKFQRHCQFPSQLLDHNLAMDKGKLAYISRMPAGEQVIIQALNKQPPLALEQLQDAFGIEDILRPSKSKVFMISLLYFFGILTLAGENEDKELLFQIPNLVIQKLYVEHLKELLLPDDVTVQEQSRVLAKQFYKTGDLQPVIDFIEKHYFKAFDNRDYGQANELTIKTAFLMLLFNNTFYITDSETELERRYADLTLIVRPEQQISTMRNFFLEFKYVKLGKKKSGEEIRQMSDQEIRALPEIVEKFAEGKTQLLDYKQRLKSKYGENLQIETMTVVALGFERIMWERV